MLIITGFLDTFYDNFMYDVCFPENSQLHISSKCAVGFTNYILFTVTPYHSVQNNIPVSTKSNRILRVIF